MPEIKKKGTGKKRRYVVRYDGAKDPKTGERNQKQKTFKTNDEAEKFVAHLILDLNQDTAIHNKKKLVKVLFHEFAENWFEVDYFQSVRPGTFVNRRYYLEQHILPFFGDKYIQDITGEDVKAFYANEKRAGYAEKSINSYHKFLSRLLKAAVKKGYLKAHPMSDFEKGDKPKDRVRVASPWNYEEIAKFLEFAEKEQKDVMYDFTISTGLRQGEVFAFPWFNLDFEERSIIVTRSVAYDENGKPELLPKSQESYRTISVPRYLLEKLKVHKENQERMKKRFGDNYEHELDLVFPTAGGGFQNPSNVRRQLYGLMKKGGVRRITFHDLRHTHARMLIRSGANPSIVQKRLGHEDIETTFKYYGHLWPNADQEAVQNLENELGKHRKRKDDED
jgi:integrase